MGVYTVGIEGKASFEARLSRKLYLNSKSKNQLGQMLGKNLRQSKAQYRVSRLSLSRPDSKHMRFHSP